MKDHIQEKRSIDIPEYHTVEEYIAILEEKASGLIDPKIENEGWDYPDYFVVGWRPMTEKEIDQAKTRRKKERERKKKEKESIEASERAQLATLLKKYGSPE